MKTYLKFLTIILLGTSTLSSAYAQDAALDENGQKLKSVIMDMIESKKNALVAKDAELVFDGDMVIEPASDYYAVTLPYLYIKYNDGSRFDIGLIAINAAPHSVPGQWKMTFALPTPMSYTDGEGEEEFHINIGGQRSSGVWTETLDYFSKLDTHFQDIEISGIQGAPTLSIPATRAVYDLETDADGKWSGPVYFSFNDITAENVDGHGSGFTIGAFDLNVEMFGYNPAATAAYQEQLQSLIAANAEGTSSPNDLPALYAALVNMVGNGFTSDYQITDFTMTNMSPERQMESITFQSANLGFDLTGFLENKVGLGLRMGFEGLETNPVLASSAQLAPQTLNIDLSLDNIPVNKLTELAINTYATSTGTGNLGNLAAMSVFFKLPTILSESGTKLLIHDNSLGNALYNVNIGGEVLSDASAVNSATADITTRIKGLDALMSALSTEIKANPQTPAAQSLQQMLLQLTILKGFAKTETDENGDILHILNVVMNPMGQILVNDNDMSALFGLIAPPSSPAKSQSVTTIEPAAPAAAPVAPAPQIETLPQSE